MQNLFVITGPMVIITNMLSQLTPSNILLLLNQNEWSNHCLLEYACASCAITLFIKA